MNDLHKTLIIVLFVTVISVIFILPPIRQVLPKISKSGKRKLFFDSFQVLIQLKLFFVSTLFILSIAYIKISSNINDGHFFMTYAILLILMVSFLTEKRRSK